MKKKILYIVTQGEWGGAQVYIYGLATKISKDDFEIAVASGGSASKELTNKLVTKNVRTFELQQLQRSINPFADLRAIIELYRLMRTYKPDIVHLNSSKVSIVGSIAARLAKVPQVIYTVHGWVFNEPNSWLKNYFYFLSEKFTAKLKDDIICVSEYDKKNAEDKKLYPQNRLVAIHNGIDLKNLNFFDKDTAREILSEKIGVSLPSHKHIIGTVGNLYKTKGHWLLVEAAKKISESIFIIIGEGPEREDLTLRIKKAGLEKRFILPGTIKQGFQYLKAFDVFVLPSVKEGFPYIILEALASGIPIVSTNVGGIREVIDKKTLIAPNDTRALVRALLSAQKPDHIDKQSISVDIMVEKTKRLYST